MTDGLEIVKNAIKLFSEVPYIFQKAFSDLFYLLIFGISIVKVIILTYFSANCSLILQIFSHVLHVTIYLAPD